MLKKLTFTALMLLFLPLVANAGLIIPSVATGSASGSISPTGSGYATAPKTFTIAAGTNYTLDYIKNNGVIVASSSINTIDATHWTYTVPLLSGTQTVYFYFKAAPANPPLLVAKTPASVTATANTVVTISGQQSTILYLPPGTKAKFKWTSSPAAAFSPISSSVTSAANIVSSFTAAATGNYNATLTLTAPGAAPSTANVTVTVQSAGVVGSNTCLSCHTGSTEATAYANSAHAVYNVTCQSCHNPTGTDSHPFTASVTTASCDNCHAPTLSTTTHPVEITASKCTVCHDSHNPAQGIADLAPSNHPAVTLYTFEEIGMQMNNGQPVPVQVDTNGKGMPYSPKQTCGTAGCHVKNGVDYTYDKISDHAFHSAQGRNEYQDSITGKLDATKNKPWLQSTAMVGKW